MLEIGRKVFGLKLTETVGVILMYIFDLMLGSLILVGGLFRVVK